MRAMWRASAAPAPESAEAPAHVRPVLRPALRVALGQLRGRGRVDCQRHAALGDARDLRGVDEAGPRGRVDDETVEDVLADVLERFSDPADLVPVGGPHRRAALHDLEGDRLSVVVAQAVMTAVAMVAATRTSERAMTPRSAASDVGNSARLRPMAARTTAQPASSAPQM